MTTSEAVPMQPGPMPPLPMQVVQRIEESQAARKLSDGLTRLTRRFVPDRDSLLRGGPLGHGVHPILTDLPLGCLASATLLDLFGGAGSRSAATLLVGAGVASALPTAVTGFADWTSLTGGDRQVGTVHALANAVALGLFAGSLASRIRGQHRSGVWLALAGGVTSGAAGYLGGHLAMSRGTADRTGSDYRDSAAPLAESAGPARASGSLSNTGST